MPIQESLDHKIKSWLKEKHFEKSPEQLPYASIPDFPDTSQVLLKSVPKLTASVGRLSISSSLGLSVPALASLLSLMERSDAEELYTEMSGMATVVDLDEELAHKWFVACHMLSPKKMPVAVVGFFQLADIHRAESFQMSLTSSLACWYKALIAPQIQMNSNLEILLGIAAQFPDRFAFVCVRAASGGDKVLSAVRESLVAINGLNLTSEQSSSILDFTMETGWLLDNRDHEQIWKLILRTGGMVQWKLTGGLVSMSSIRFLAGLLRGIENTKGLSLLLAEERIHKAMTLFGALSAKEIEESFSCFPQLEELIDYEIKFDFVTEALSHRIAERDQSELGNSVVVFLHRFPDGVTIPNILQFLNSTGDELSSDLVTFLNELLSKSNSRLSSSNQISFCGIVSRVFPFSSSQDRTALRTFQRALCDMDPSLAEWAIIQLDEATLSNLAFSSILSASSLILRASNEANSREFLSRILVTGKLIDALAPIDRKRAISGLVPSWVETILSFDLSAEEKIIEFVNKINDVKIRSRYLENIVTGLLNELQPEDRVFDECLAFAVNGYNSSRAIEKLREVEHKVFKKVSLAGGRVQVVDGLMVEMLVIPGFEGDKTEQLISFVRLICNRFSRLAVWEDVGDSLFNDFIGTGVSNLLRAFVDNPLSLDFVNGETIENLLGKLFSDEQNSISTSRIVNPGGTAITFFSSILPQSIYLFGREAKSLPAFLFEIADEFSRSVGGMTAGEDFARYLLTRIDLEIQQDCVVVLDSWLSQKTPPPLQISDQWSNRIREEWNGLVIRQDMARMKLYGAVSALTLSSESHTRETILTTAGYLYKHMERAGIQGVTGLSLQWSRAMMDELLALSGDTPLLALLKGDVSVELENRELFSYLESIEGFMEQDIFHAWRQAALPSLLNCALEIVLVADCSPEMAAEMAEAATDAVEYLGYNNANGFLSTLQESFRHATSPEIGFDLMEKYFLLPLWKRNSAERLDLLLLGMESSRLLTSILQERLALEERVGGKVSFMRNFATFFVVVERALLEIQSSFEKSKIVDGLMESWIFSGIGLSSKKAVDEISQTSELVRDIFRRVKFRSGVVSASEAGEISSDMRKKYRDNADSVAIILRWTVDPQREGLLQLLEESQHLLQAAGTDTELMRLLDIHGARESFLQEAKPYSENPEALKKFLKALSVGQQ